MQNLPLPRVRGINQGGVLILVILRLGVYPLFFIGWRSNSKYALLGAIRGVAQTISYEIILALILFVIFLGFFEFSLGKQVFKRILFHAFGVPLIVLLFIACVAETNRTPFDFSEGERELVSGFNTEFGGGTFAIIFMREYGIIVFFSFLLAFIFTGKAP